MTLHCAAATTITTTSATPAPAAATTITTFNSWFFFVNFPYTQDLLNMHQVLEEFNIIHLHESYTFSWCNSSQLFLAILQLKNHVTRCCCSFAGQHSKGHQNLCFFWGGEIIVAALLEVCRFRRTGQYLEQMKPWRQNSFFFFFYFISFTFLFYRSRYFWVWCLPDISHKHCLWVSNLQCTKNILYKICSFV